MERINSLPHLPNLIRCCTFAIAMLSLCLHPPLYAADTKSAGVLLAFSGTVEIIHEETKRPATRRAELFSGDIIVTDDGQAQIRFADGTMLTLYRNTRFSVDDYHYSQDKNDRAQFSLLNGVMHTLTGQIDKNSYLLKTRLANLGIRGTEYSVHLSDTLHVSVDQGRVELSNAGGTIQISAGQSAFVIGTNLMPKPTTGGKIDLRMHTPGPGGGPLGRPSGSPPNGGNGGANTPPPPPPPGTQNISRQSDKSGQRPGQSPPANTPPPRGQ